MDNIYLVRSYFTLFTFTLLLISCNELAVENNIEEALKPVEEVTLISGADNASISVNTDQSYYFNIEFSNINANEIIGNGVNEGWCIDWKKPIDTNGTIYSGIKLYSTFNVKGWEKINYLLNIKNLLQSNNPEITFREIQLAIWSLRGHPKFDLDTISLQDLPRDMISNGQPKFNQFLVKEIIQIVEQGYDSFDFKAGTRFAVIAETPADVQTVITVVEKK